MGLFGKKRIFKLSLVLAVLDPIPQRKKKCPSCGKDIYVRTNPFKGEKVLVNYTDALSIDAISTLGITEKEYRAESEELAHKFKMATPFLSDIVWGIISRRQLDSVKRRDWNRAKMLYWEQARLLHQLGKGFFKVLQESAKCELYCYQAMGIKKAEISVAGGSSCIKCQSLDVKNFSITEALEAMPIPVKDCENGFCRCLYSPTR
ncbi:hypothetical protein ACFLVF_03200 [Chloroflexota bacterium]